MIAEHNQELADTLNARTFALAQTDNAMMMNICSTCQGAQSECQERLDANPPTRDINGAWPTSGWPTRRVIVNKDLLWVLVADLGLDELRNRVRGRSTG